MECNGLEDKEARNTGKEEIGAYEGKEIGHIFRFMSILKAEKDCSTLNKICFA